MFTPLAFNKESIVTRGLVFHVDAADRTSFSPGSGVWKDLTGNGNDGTLINGPTFDFGNGGSIVFDGANDYVHNTNYTNSNTPSGSISCWLYPDSGGNNDQMVVNIGGTTTLGASRIIRLFNNQWSWATYGSTPQDWNGIASISFNTWSYIVGVWEGTSLNFYINTTRYSTTRTGVITPTGTTFRAGSAVWDASNRPYTGKIGLVQIYNRALSPSEITQNYNALKGRFGL